MANDFKKERHEHKQDSSKHESGYQGGQQKSASSEQSNNKQSKVGSSWEKPKSGEECKKHGSSSCNCK